MVRDSKIAISVDIEDWYHSRHITSLDDDPNSDVINFYKSHNKNYNYLENPLELILEKFKTYNIKATFFIVADLLNQYASTIKKIIEAGHEIGCHELHHISYLGSSEKERSLFKENISKSKAMLEDFSGKEVIGFRAPSAVYRDWMSDELFSLGFLYDSSVAKNSLYNKTNFNLNLTNTVPFELNDPSAISPQCKNSLVEIPWPYLNILGFKIPTGGGPTLRFFGSHITSLGLNQSLSRGDTSFYFHPLDISNDPLPDIIYSKRKKFWINKGNTTLRRLDTILKKYQYNFCNCHEIYLRYKLKNK